MKNMSHDSHVTRTLDLRTCSHKRQTPIMNMMASTVSVKPFLELDAVGEDFPVGAPPVEEEAVRVVEEPRVAVLAHALHVLDRFGDSGRHCWKLKMNTFAQPT